MDTIKVKFLPNLRAIVAILFVLVAIASVAAIMDSNIQVAQAQNATAATNQTGAATQNQTATNQSTSASVSPLGNLTRADFEGALDRLRAARDAIYDNDDEAAYEALNEADSELYGRTN